MNGVAIEQNYTLTDAVSCPNSSITYKIKSIDYPQRYSLTSTMLMFFGFSFFGWVWEVGLTLFTDGLLVNRGVMQGPWLPIYGVGSVLMLVLLKRFQSKPFLCFGMGVVVCGIIEFSTSWILEKLLHAIWWDYSDKFMNLHGRIYLLGLLFFGAAGCLIIYVAAPRINQKLLTLSEKTRIIACTILGLIFIADLIFSFITPNMGVGVSLMV